MGKISLDLSTLKAAGVYTLEIDNSVRTSTTTNSLRLIPGFSNKGPFNRPVFLQDDSERISIFGDIDTKLEHKGCYFNRMMRTLLAEGPIIALNLLNVDNSYNGPDQVNFAAMSLDTATPNPKISGSNKYGQYDYIAKNVDAVIYGYDTGDMIPFVGNTPFSSLYNRSRFWIPDKELLTGAAAKALGTSDFTSGRGSYEYTNFLNFANVGTEEFSILVFKPENIIGYDITAESWYGSADSIPFGWIRPSDYISDYFLQVVCVKGNWSNYPVLSTDPMWKAYFDKKGIRKDRINNFIGAEGVKLIGSWVGCIIPDFINKQGDNLSLENKINARTETTGLLMSFNEDAAHVVAGDFTGPDLSENDDNFVNDGKFTWGIDIDGDREINSENGEGIAPYVVDMVGHGAFLDNAEGMEALDSVTYEFLHASNDADVVTNGHTVHTIIPGEAAGINNNIVLLRDDNIDYEINLKKYTTTVGEKTTQLFKEEEIFAYTSEFTKDGVVINNEDEIWADKEHGVLKDGVVEKRTYDYATLQPNVTATPIAVDHDGKNCTYATGVYIATDFLNMPVLNTENFTATRALDIIAGKPYYILYTQTYGEGETAGSIGLIRQGDLVISRANVKVVHFDLDEDGQPITSTRELVDYVSTVKDKKVLKTHTLKLAFTIQDTTYFAFFKYTAEHTSNNRYVLRSFEQGVADNKVTAGATLVPVDAFADAEIEAYSDMLRSNDNGVTSIPVTLAEGDQPTDVKKVDPDIAALLFILRPIRMGNAEEGGLGTGHNIGFLSYTFIEDDQETDDNKKPVLEINNARYFRDEALWDVDNVPVTEVTSNMFIVTSPGDENGNNGWNGINVGTLVRNITYYNNPGEANTYKVIPGVTRVIRKQFITVSNGQISYLGKMYNYYGETAVAKNGAKGFYLYTTIDPVLIQQKETTITNNEGKEVAGTINYIVRQLPLSDNTISGSLRFIPLKGLKVTSRHRPGYAVDGTISIEQGIDKIYSVLTDSGIRRGLCNPTMVDFRYIVDSMSYGLESSLGGKVHLTNLAQDRGSCLAVLNMPSAKQFAISSNPIFCDSYTSGSETRPSFDTKYIPEGGNQEMGSSKVFTLPDENDGSKYAAAFFPNLIYSEGGRKISVPPAADVCNVLANKFTGVSSPYAICANMNGIIRNRYVTDIEFAADTTDREYLEPFGVNTIIKENGYIMIYGNQTCYQTLKSDMNKLHVRENLNTIEIECNAALKQFNFLYNTAQTRASIVQTLTPILSVMQVSGAIDSYTITCDESNNTPEIIEGDYGIVDIAVWFNHGMEKILTRITVNRYGSNQSSNE